MNDRLSNYLKKAGFYLTRLRRSSPAELAYRLRQAGTHFRVGWLVRRGKLPCRFQSLSLTNIRTLSLPEFHGKVERSDVERILSGFRFNLNADQNVISSCEHELRHRYYPPISSLGDRVDIRALWEAARLQHVTILLAWLHHHPDTPDRETIKAVARSEILRWLAKNPFLYGLHYLSVMECGLRLPVLFYALKILDNLCDSDAEAILKGVFLHAWWIEKNLSLHSSLGNHTVCEAMGLVFAGGMFRETETGRRWLKTGIIILEQELPHQVLVDGGPAEQAFGYHRFVLDIYWLAVDFLECNNLRCCDDFKARLLSGEGFLSSVCGPGAMPPAIGDCDGGQALAPGLFPRRLATAGQQPPFRTFTTSGYSVIRGNNTTLLTFDHGPLGLPPLYNHGHADALSVTLSLEGTPFLVDSGTYRYNGVPAFRRYFKSTRAHNTVTIDGLDQATQLTGFVWGEPYTAHLDRCLETSAGLLVEASHDGYCRLDEPVRHGRSILSAADGSWLISDLFQGEGRHTFELNFHFHPGVSLTEKKWGWLAEHNGHGLRIELAKGAFQLRRGAVEPPLGWFSPAYNVKLPSVVLQSVRSGMPAEVSFETRITAMPADE